jgi:hypothetical protein
MKKKRKPLTPKQTEMQLRRETAEAIQKAVAVEVARAIRQIQPEPGNAPAAPSTLHKLHALTANALLQGLRAQMVTGKVRASFLNVARGFVKDNHIISEPGMRGLIAGLEKIAYPFDKSAK